MYVKFIWAPVDSMEDMLWKPQNWPNMVISIDIWLLW